MKTIKTWFKEYQLNFVRGTVADTSKNMETKVRGGGGGGFTSNGSGFSAPVTVTSTTTIHDQIFLIDSTGKEHAFQLSDFNVACRSGNELSVIWAKQNNSKPGAYIAVINHTISHNFFNDKILTKLCRTHWILPLVGSIITIKIPSIGYALVWVPWVVWYISGKVKSKQFKNDIINNGI